MKKCFLLYFLKPDSHGHARSIAVITVDLCGEPRSITISLWSCGQFCMYRLYF